MIRYCEATDKEWKVANTLKEAIAIAEKESEKQLKLGTKIIESDHRKEDYFFRSI